MEVCRRMDFVKFWRRPHPATISLIGSLALGLSVLPTAWSQLQSQEPAATPTGEVLERFVADVEDLTAMFEQQVYDADGQLLEESAGEFKLLRPNRFAWYYATPDEIEIVADGESLWIYDVELEQITVAPLTDLATSPALLLSGGSSVNEHYEINEIASADDDRWLELWPLDADSEFSSAKVAFRDGVPRVIELVDGLLQTTRIQFSAVEVNSGLRPREFRFDPPDGVDVIGADD